MPGHFRGHASPSFLFSSSLPLGGDDLPASPLTWHPPRKKLEIFSPPLAPSPPSSSFGSLPPPPAAARSPSSSSLATNRMSPDADAAVVSASAPGGGAGGGGVAGGASSSPAAAAANGRAVVRWDQILPRRSLRVLLVEHDDSTRQVVTALLRKCGYRGESHPLPSFLSSFPLPPRRRLLCTATNQIGARF